MLEISGRSVSYGAVAALRDVSFNVPRGEVTAVVGANGAGKSTLMRTLAGLNRPLAGQAKLDGTVITGRVPEAVVRMGVALVPEGRAVISELSVEENLRLGGMWRPRSARAASYDAVVDLFPVLGERARFAASTLSGGERQQLAIGRALMCAPQCLLLDEPSLGLAPLIVAQILELVGRLAVENNLAVLMVEQNASVALRIAQTGIVLNLGRIAGQGPSAQLLASPELRHIYFGTK